MLILAKGQISISGSIVAYGTAGLQGGGGGAGGVVFVASQTGVSLQTPAYIDVTGSSGGISGSNQGSGGGGAGGYVRIVSPANSVDPTRVFVLGGSAGSNGFPVSQTIAVGGGAGGSCIDAGGAGGSIPAGRNATSTGATLGSDGFAVVTTADPTSLF